MIATNQEDSHDKDKPCPSCGYCPTCGRKDESYRLVPWPYIAHYPVYPKVPWYYVGNNQIRYLTKEETCQMDSPFPPEPGYGTNTFTIGNTG